MTPTSTSIEQQKPGLEISRVRQALLFRFNPVRYATSERLGYELDAFYTGRLTIARFWEAMQNRDADIKVATNKRGDSVENLEWQICIDDGAVDDEDAAMVQLADDQKEALQKFYSRLCVSDILKQDTRGGVGLLCRQMIDARAKGWAVHEITWEPKPEDGSICAKLTYCPLYWFENTEGRLRFLPQDWLTYGVDMVENEWMVTACDNYMEAVTMLWLCKRSLLQAWVRFCEKFGQPFPVIKTDSSKGSPEWTNAEDALAAISEDWGLVLNQGANLEFPSLDRSGDNTFQALHEDLKRTIITVILGSDLSTISAGSGAGQGASLQGQEDAKRERADACLISETLNRSLDKYVLEYMFGEGTPILAKFVLVPSKRQDINQELAVDKFFAEQQVEISKADLRERYGRSEPRDGQDIIGISDAQHDQTEAPNPEDNQQQSMDNAQLANDLRTTALAEIAKARALDVIDVAESIKHVMAIDDPEKMLNALKAWRANSMDRAKRLISNPKELSATYEKVLASSVLSGLTSAQKV